MIKIKIARPQGELYVFGLSRKNVEALQANRPIEVELAPLGGPPITILIYAGETEEAMLAEFVKAGLVPADAAGGLPN